MPDDIRDVIVAFHKHRGAMATAFDSQHDFRDYPGLPRKNAKVFSGADLKGLSQGYTMYSIKNDEVLKASRLFNKFIEDNGKTRLGDSSLDFFTVDGINTIHARAEVVEQVIGHSYYAQDERLVTDLFLLLNHESIPDKRMLIGVEDIKDRHFWFLRP